MTPTVPNVLVALLWALAACALVWLVTLPLRRRSLSALLASVVLTGSAASIGATLAFMHAMLLPTNEQVTVVVVVCAAGLVGAFAAGAVARRLTKDREVLRAAVAELGQGLIPTHDGRRLTSELEQVRRELSVTAQGLADSRARERALESARRELVGWVSHDLRTPLAGLRAMSEALEDGLVDDPDPYYKQIRASVERLSGMVDDLFDLSRIQAGSFARDVDDIPLDDLVSDCLAALEPLAAAQGVHLSGRMAGAATVAGNGPELNRALTNLVANAIRHTRADGRVDVLVGLSADDAAPRAEVVVNDECGGIADDDIARVFDVGFRGEPARTPHSVHPAGAGLGLAITRGIVEAHSGSVHVENTAEGCRFTVCLPVAV
ncbi:MAG: HAMP domain-containing sensor histidine kinase [Pseudonocardiales bacterium]